MYNKVSYISNCYKKEKNVIYIIKVVNVQCYVYKKEYSCIGSPAPSLLSSISVEKITLHTCLPPNIMMKKCYVYKQHCQFYVYKKEYSLSSPILNCLIYFAYIKNCIYVTKLHIYQVAFV